MTDPIKLMQERRSEAKLEAPAPIGAELEEILRCALRAPDHGLLRPWRYIVLEGRGRDSLGQAWADILAGENPDTSPAALEKASNQPLRAPMIIVAVTREKEHPKVPVLEQHLSTAAGVAYLLLALQAKGFAGYWRTGAMAYHPGVHEFLELGSGEKITGFLYVGTPKKEPAACSQPALEDHLTFRRN